MSEQIKQIKEHEAANQAQESETKRDTSAWMGGVILIGLGVLFLLGNFTDFRLDNWWALFILVPVVAAWASAFRTAEQTGTWTREARRQIGGSLFPLFVAAIFLFNWDWGQVWPGFLVIAGLNALLGSWFDRE